MSDTSKMDHLYDQITAAVDQSISTVSEKAFAAHGNQDLEGAINSSRTLLERFREKTNGDIQKLKEIADWSTFTIAFYGETNAGKSTLIETLRIMLGDNDKLAMQAQYQALAKDLRIDPHSLAALETSIQQLELQLAESQEQVERLKHQQQEEERQHGVQLDVLRSALEHRRKEMNLWQRLVSWFGKLSEEKALHAHRQQLVHIQTENRAKLEAFAAKHGQVNAELNARHGDRARLENSFSQLVPLQDGGIIGNGRSDFTLRSHVYRFTVSGQAFQLIDVPGIEGDEQQVMDAIKTSVKKAHAVFYVTRTATPPGSGSDGQEGTIDKIKRQLGEQTEVWAIYNKSATNPQILQGRTLINPNDSIGLADMDTSLTGTLGAETYKGHICVSGMPAFLAKARCLVPGNPHIRSRDKFLAAMGESEILKRSGMDAFAQFISAEICQNFQKKIADANTKKIRSCLHEGIEHLRQARENFAHAAKKLQVQQQSASSQIDALRSSTSEKLKGECHDELAQKKTIMRTAIYEYIGADQSNDDFKERLTTDIEELKTSVGQDLEARFAKVFDLFKHEAGEIIKKNQKNVDEILRYTIDDPFSSLKLSFHTNFKMDNGINVVGVISTLGGAAALVWASFLASNPVGWTTAAVLGAIGLVFSFYKAVRSFFSSDYKKEQQRKSADENLDKVFGKLTEMLDDNLESAMVKIDEALVEVKTQMRIPYDQAVSTKTALEGTTAKMVALHNRLGSKRNPAVETAGTPLTAKAA